MVIKFNIKKREGEGEGEGEGEKWKKRKTRNLLEDNKSFSI